MAYFDVFNGDADGICALLQLRQHTPRIATLITGVKRDIGLLSRVSASSGDVVTVLDVAVEKNRLDLDRLLQLGAEIFYVDHHNPGEMPSAAGLQLLINTAPEVCTSALVNGHLSGACASWAVVGCFGDNLDQTAERVAQTLPALPDLKLWRELGILINYNAYGAHVSDLHFHPESLYRRLLPHASPDICLAEDPELMRLSAELVASARWRGPCELEYMRTEEGEYYLMEMNPRFPAWVYLAVGCGQNHPEALVDLALGQKPQAMNDYEVGKMFIRYSQDLVVPMQEFEKISTLGEL